MSCKCHGNGYLSPSKYYDYYQRTRPDLGFFLIDHVRKGADDVPLGHMGEKEINVEIINAFLTGLCYSVTLIVFFFLLKMKFY